MDRKCCEQIMTKYYREMYNYFFVKLKYNKQSAEDCTQELFMIFLKKHENLDENNNIRIWLYRTADNVVKTYYRKNHGDLSLEDCTEALNTPAPDCFADDSPNLSDWLTDEESELVRLYYDTDYGDRKSAANKLGITVTALYQKINKIKQKIKNGKKQE